MKCKSACASFCTRSGTASRCGWRPSPYESTHILEYICMDTHIYICICTRRYCRMRLETFKSIDALSPALQKEVIMHVNARLYFERIYYVHIYIYIYIYIYMDTHAYIYIQVIMHVNARLFEKIYYVQRFGDVISVRLAMMFSSSVSE